MCLELKNENAKPQIAENDIVVYKFLKDGKKLKPEFHGKEFTGIIKNFTVNGKISIDKRVFFCTDEINLNGIHADDKLGYKYSWGIDKHVKSIKVDGVEIIKDGCVLDNAKVLTFLTPYQNVEIKIGETHKSELIKYGPSIEEGIHSFKSLKAANYFASFEEKKIIAKCIIPKGSEYYIGEYDKGYVSYASDTLKYIKVLSNKFCNFNLITYLCILI
jgi:hypothetical protein